MRGIREARGLTREQLAYRSGVSTSTIARIELRGQMPRAAKLVRLARELDVKLGDLEPNARQETAAVKAKTKLNIPLAFDVDAAKQPDPDGALKTA
jgi:transcriptional regulator with XRE-family HTH domain